MKNTLIIAVLLGIVLTFIAVKYSSYLMLISGAKEDTIQWATEYFSIMQASIPLSALSMAITAAQRGVGNTKITMYVNITANIVDLFFNYLLIEGNLGFPALGVKGAAIASVIGIFAGLILSIVSVLRPYSYISLRDQSEWRLHRETLGALTKVGSSAVVEQFSIRIGFFVFVRMVADLGTDYFATHQICMQFLSLTFTFADGLAVAATVLVGQNLGAKRPDISMLYGKIGQRIALIVSLCLIFIIIIFRYPLVSIFTDEIHIIDMAANLMFLVAVFQPFQTSQVVLTGCLRGAGDTRFVAIIMIVCILFVRPIITYLAVYQFNWGIYGAWLASLSDIILRLILVYIRFNKFKWAKIKV